MTALVDRRAELEGLQRAAASPPALVIVRGRRRVGKSFLLSHAYAGPRVVSFQADEQPEAVQLELLAREAGRILPGRPVLAFPSWDEALRFFEEQSRVEPLTVVLDEVQYLCESQPALPSMVQRAWDRWDRERLPIVLVLCGSALTFMEGLLAGESPTYGRSSYRPLITPLDFRQAAGFASSLRPRSLIERYAVLGGTPQYQVWAGDKRLHDVLLEEIFTPGGPLYEEPDHLVRKEGGVRDPRRYLAALEAIASGRTRTGEVASRLGMDTGNTSRLLDRLTRLGYIQLRTPVGDRRGRARAVWRIQDPFLRFWFRYVRPNRSRLERGRAADVLAEIEMDLPAHIGVVFEDCCRGWVGKYSGLAGEVDDLGSWWSRDGTTEVDVVAIEGRSYRLLGSCKWTRADVGTSVLEDLYEARATLGPRAARAQLAIFARSGFSSVVRERARDENVMLVNAEDLFADPN